MKSKILLLLTVALLSACISKKKYTQLANDKLRLELQKAEVQDSLIVALAENKDFQKQIKNNLRDISKLQGDTTALGDLYRNLINDYVKLSKSSSSDAKRLSQQMQKVGHLSQELEEKNRMLELDQQHIDSLNSDLQAREQKVAELEQMLKAKEAYMEAIQNQIKQALLAFEDEDLTVEVKNGKVYISLNEDLLFKSGSYNVDAKGYDALKKIALALKDSDVQVNVEGHTDDVPVKAGTIIKGNWELSVLRATSIVRILQKEGVPPQKIIASGRSEYQPKVDGKSAEARSANRRTEIIISPNLDELHTLIQSIED
ncbi:OmpA family protein [Cyclobacteriaceae bacterium]|nr:OmpA family protein [Cyclobacteriaceae bacterium]